MSNDKQQMEINSWPDELRLLWDKSLTAHEAGGLNAIRGFYYQYLYSLQLMSDLLSGKYDAYACEWGEDFMAWKYNSKGKLKEILLVQVKTSLRNCFLKNTAEVKKVLHKFSKAAAKYTIHTDAKLSFRIVYNPYHNCTLNGCTKHIPQLIPYRDIFSENGLITQSTDVISLELEQFLPIPITKEALLEKLQFLEEFQPDLLQFLKSSVNLAAFVRNVFGLVAPFS